MSAMLQFIDQTVAEACAAGLPSDQVLLVARLVSELPVAALEVSWQQVQDYPELPAQYAHCLQVSLKPSVTRLNRLARSGVRQITLTCLTRPGEAVQPELWLALERAAELRLAVTVRLDHAALMPVEQVAALCRRLEEKEVACFGYGDSSSNLDPFMTVENLSRLQEYTALTIEYHGHNKYGLATANCLSAIQSGAQRIATAIAGIGRQGHGAFEEVLMSARHLLKTGQQPVPDLAKRCHAILACLGRTAAVDKPIIGDNIFAHESGLHVYGIRKDATVYEAFSPEEIGLARYLVVGKHSGLTSVQAVLEERHICLPRQGLERLLATVRRLVGQYKRPLSPTEVVRCAGSPEGTRG